MNKTEVNSREHVNAITLKSGKVFEGPNFGNSSSEKDKEQAIEGKRESQNDHVVIDIHVPPSNLNSNAIPFPHRLKKNRKDREFDKFFQNF